MMQPFTELCAIAAPIDIANVDTDQIIPLHRLAKHRVGENGWGTSFFYNHRFDDKGVERSQFVLNQPYFRDAQILVGAENFGCGSSREIAVTAMKDFGIRAVVAPSFGDIFRANCGQNAILAFTLPADVCAAIRRSLAESPGMRLTIDLKRQTVAVPGMGEIQFDVEPMTKDFLLEGLDELDFTRRYLPDIERWESALKQREPWSVLSH